MFESDSSREHTCYSRVWSHSRERGDKCGCQRRETRVHKVFSESLGPWRSENLPMLNLSM
jgi:hypothetical protein